MAARSYWGVTPRESVEAECASRGRQAVVDGCARLITGGEADTVLIVALGGPAARGLLDAGLPEGQLYWLRVWAARGLLWVWDDSALSALRGKLRCAWCRGKIGQCEVVGHPRELGAVRERQRRPISGHGVP